MAKAPDYAKMMQDASAAFKLDPMKFREGFVTTAGYGEKLSKVALEAAEQSTELSAQWTRDVLAKLGDVTRAKDAPQDYAQAMAEFARAQAEMMNQQANAFAEIARRVQAETMEVLMSAAKDAGSEAQDVMRSAGETARKSTK